jgi:hypothetical protein
MHDELYNLYSSPNFIGMIKPNRTGWAEDVTCKRTYMHKIMQMGG